MAGGWDMIAFHDPKASPVATMCASSSGAIEELLPKLAEKAGLGAKLPYTIYSGKHKYENGEIRVQKEQY